MGKRNLLSSYLLGLGGALVMALSFGVQAQIAGSKHDLTGTGGAGNKVTNGSPEICVFCHTPHASNTNLAAPLWNKAVSPSALTTYSQTSSSTMDGTVTTGGVSLACLACHDGTQAMDVMINTPGSGGVTAGARAYSGNTWSSNVDGKIVQTSVANLGTDLTNDHPIQIPYCGGGMTLAGGVGVLTNCADGDFNVPVTMATNTIAYFDGAPTNGKRDKNDIQLYSRSGGYFVECGSCHDPHNSTTNTFLRRSNAASAVCLTCHNK